MFTCLAPAYDILILSNSVTHQSIVLESCSNTKKMQQVFKSPMKKSFFWFLVLLFLWVTSYVGQVFCHIGSGYLVLDQVT